jgi:hypothetical protein
VALPLAKRQTWTQQLRFSGIPGILTMIAAFVESGAAWSKTPTNSRKELNMLRKYSDFFSTLHDEDHPVGNLGRGTHYSILRAVVWNPSIQFHDFAVIWDEDHDTRVIWVVEQLHAKQILSEVLMIGERKGSITVITRTPPSKDFETKVTNIGTSVPTDSFSTDVECLAQASGLIINDNPSRIQAYLAGIDALWKLGTKPAEFTTQPFHQ